MLSGPVPRAVLSSRSRLRPLTPSLDGYAPRCLLPLTAPHSPSQPLSRLLPGGGYGFAFLSHSPSRGCCMLCGVPNVRTAICIPECPSHFPPRSRRACLPVRALIRMPTCACPHMRPHLYRSVACQGLTPTLTLALNLTLNLTLIRTTTSSTKM